MCNVDHDFLAGLFLHKPTRRSFVALSTSTKVFDFRGQVLACVDKNDHGYHLAVNSRNYMIRPMNELLVYSASERIMTLRDGDGFAGPLAIDQHDNVYAVT